MNVLLRPSYIASQKWWPPPLTCLTSFINEPYQVAWNFNFVSQVCDFVCINAAVDGLVPQDDTGVSGVLKHQSRVNEWRHRDSTFRDWDAAWPGVDCCEGTIGQTGQFNAINNRHFSNMQSTTLLKSGSQPWVVCRVLALDWSWILTEENNSKTEL